MVNCHVLTHDPVIGADTPSYINFNAMRPPLYPVVIWLFKWSGQYQFKILMWFRMFLLGASLYYLRGWLQKNLKIKDFLIFLLFILTIITTFRLAL